MMLGIDSVGGLKEIEGKRRWQFILLYLGKIAVDFGTAIKALEGLLKFAVDRQVITSSNVLTNGVTRLLLVREIAFVASWQAMLLIFIIEQLVIYFSDNDLQDWCESCVFGEVPESELISTEKIDYLNVKFELLEKQESMFNKAVKVIG